MNFIQNPANFYQLVVLVCIASVALIVILVIAWRKMKEVREKNMQEDKILGEDKDAVYCGKTDKTNKDDRSKEFGLNLDKGQCILKLLVQLMLEKLNQLSCLGHCKTLLKTEV